MDPAAPQLPVVVSAPKQRTTLGSLAVAMLLGAVLAVGLLYLWGGEIAKEEAAAAQAE